MSLIRIEERSRLIESMPIEEDNEYHLLDRRDGGDLAATCGAIWKVATDTVMGGVSHATLVPSFSGEKPCLCLSGSVSLENNGGFVQASLDLTGLGGYFDASMFTGIMLEISGDNKPYNVHLRTKNTNLAWQSYRAALVASEDWQIIRLPFDEFIPHRNQYPWKSPLCENWELFRSARQVR